MRLPRLALIDALLIAGSVTYGGYLVLTQDQPSKERLEARAQHVLPSYSLVELEQLQLKDPAEEFTILADPERPGEFRLRGESEGDADVALMRELSSALEFATFKRKVDQADVPSSKRQAPPQLELRVVTTQGETTVRLYDHTDTSAASEDGEVYAEVSALGESQWGVVSARLLTTLQRSKQEFRGSQLFPFSIDKTLSLRIVDAHSALTLRGDELGFVLEPEQRRADRTLSDILFYHLAQAKIGTFLPFSQAQALIVQDAQHKTVQQAGPGKTVEILVGGRCPGDDAALVALRNTPPRVAGCIPRTLWAGLSLGRDALIDRTVTVLKSDEIDHVIVSGAERSLDLMRKGSTWSLVSQDHREVPNTAAEEFLEALTEGKLQLLSAPPQAPRTGTVTIIGHTPRRGADEGTARQLIDVHEISPQRVLAHRLDDDTWLDVPPSLAWALSEQDFWTRSRAITQLDPEALSWLEREVAASSTAPVGFAGKSAVVRQDAAFIFEVNESAASPSSPDQRLCRQLFQELAQLSAVRMLKERAKPDQPWLRITFGTGDTNTRHELLVAERVRGGHRAWSSMTSSQFVLDEETALRLAAPLWDRSKAQLNLDDYVRIELKSGDRSVSLERVAGELQATVGELSGAEVGPLVEALKGLTVLARLPGQPLAAAPRIIIEATASGHNSPPLRLEILGSFPYEEGFAFSARLRGEPGAFVLSPASVRALEKLL